jgi:hypothetical protein
MWSHDMRNTGVMFPFLVSVVRGGIRNDVEHTAYGTIQNIFVHQISPEAPLRTIFEVEWKTQIGSFFKGRMPRLKDDPRSDWNLEHRYEFADRAFCQNVGFWWTSARNPKVTDRVAVFRESRERPLERTHSDAV